jgi:hypothetical protein
LYRAISDAAPLLYSEYSSARPTRGDESLHVALGEVTRSTLATEKLNDAL